MVNFVEKIDFDQLVEKSLKNVIYYALKIVEEQGLPGEDHFYITFRTNFPGVVVSKNLKIQYPDTMTIVLQNQFANLVVRHNEFLVDLSFGGVSQTLKIPYDAITYFADPFAKFGLSFGAENINDDTEPDEVSSGTTEIKNADSVASVISIDQYLKK